MTYRVFIAGAGKIGAMVACMLAETQAFDVHLADLQFEGLDLARLFKAVPAIHKVCLSVEQEDQMKEYLKAHQIQAIVSSLPYYLNVPVAKLAAQLGIHYFDLTEDDRVTEAVKAIAEGASSAFVPQCGLAPGFIGIVAHSLMQKFDVLETAKLRVGALPQYSSNALHYAMTWSTEGLINEYGNPCYGIEEGKLMTLPPLEGLEPIQLDGLSYEAFNTSGGLGSLASMYRDKMHTLNYKTIRYPGHCAKMRLLMNDLRLNQDRATLKKILEHAIPKTYQDVVLIYVSVSGYIENTYLEESYMKKVYPQTVGGLPWSAIQVTTAAGICAALDLVLNNEEAYHGLVLQEEFSLEMFLKNRFGRYYA